MSEIEKLKEQIATLQADFEKMQEDLDKLSRPMIDVKALAQAMRDISRAEQAARMQPSIEHNGGIYELDPVTLEYNYARPVKQGIVYENLEAFRKAQS